MTPHSYQQRLGYIYMYIGVTGSYSRVILSLGTMDMQSREFEIFIIVVSSSAPWTDYRIQDTEYRVYIAQPQLIGVRGYIYIYIYKWKNIKYENHENLKTHIQNMKHMKY